MRQSPSACFNSFAKLVNESRDVGFDTLECGTLCLRNSFALRQIECTFVDPCPTHDDQTFSQAQLHASCCNDQLRTNRACVDHVQSRFKNIKSGLCGFDLFPASAIGGSFNLLDNWYGSLKHFHQDLCDGQIFPQLIQLGKSVIRSRLCACYPGGARDRCYRSNCLNPCCPIGYAPASPIYAFENRPSPNNHCTGPEESPAAPLNNSQSKRSVFHRGILT